MLQRARLGATEANAADQRWATPWGRLLMLKRISEAEHAAAEEYGYLLGQMRRIIDAAAPWTSSLALEIRAGGPSMTDDEKRDRKIMARQQEAWLELHKAGAPICDPVHKMIREQRDPDPNHLPHVRTGLARLAFVFGFAKQRQPEPLDG